MRISPTCRILFCAIATLTQFLRTQAQEPQHLSVNIGTVTRYSGSLPQSEAHDCQDFLANLELQMAAEFAKNSGVQYLDRGNLNQIFHEVHLSSGSLFDSSSGALRGLLGRLDYLIVAEASSPKAARVRVLDVETGAVKVATMCQPHTTIFGSVSTTPPDCISTIVGQVASLARVRLGVKQDRLTKAAAAQRATDEQRAKLFQNEKDEE